jgi:phage/plasmid-associated DNA primase
MKKVVIHIADEHVSTLIGLVSDIAELILVKRLVEEEQAQPAPSINGLKPKANGQIVHVVGKERSRSGPGAIERIAADLEATASEASKPVRLVDWQKAKPYPNSTVYTAIKWAQRKGMIRVDMREGVLWLVPKAFAAVTPNGVM